MPAADLHAPIQIIGGGSAGISVAARLRRAGQVGITIVEPSPVHYYQPAFTLVGGGVVSARSTVRTEASVMPRGVRWIRTSAVRVDADARNVFLEDGRKVSYRSLRRIRSLPDHGVAKQGVARGRQLYCAAGPSLPFMHEAKPRRLFWLMKRYALGPLYWKRMLRGRA